MRLKRLLIADPRSERAKHTAEACAPLADERSIAITGSEAVRLAQEQAPEIAIVDFELENSKIDDVLAALRRILPKTLLVVTFRAPEGPDMKALATVSADALLPHPFDLSSLNRIAVRRFAMDSRFRSRVDMVVEVRRTDGTLVGNTLDISLGGMLVDLAAPLRTHDSLVVDLLLPDEEIRVDVTVLAVEGQLPNLVWARFAFRDLDGVRLERLKQSLAAHTGGATSTGQ